VHNLSGGNGVHHGADVDQGTVAGVRRTVTQPSRVAMPPSVEYNEYGTAKFVIFVPVKNLRSKNPAPNVSFESLQLSFFLSFFLSF
jgi:hypothetical protein